MLPGAEVCREGVATAVSPTPLTCDAPTGALTEPVLSIPAPLLLSLPDAAPPVVALVTYRLSGCARAGLQLRLAPCKILVELRPNAVVPIAEEAVECPELCLLGVPASETSLLVESDAEAEAETTAAEAEGRAELGTLPSSEGCIHTKLGL
mmetsp:Transcript_67478/g.161924  ORF Transcript_67478/g.161924 Transcript_67478/m.161924 type:complete len:151 (-) Transcript_67478:1149-1601(-)